MEGLVIFYTCFFSSESHGDDDDSDGNEDATMNGQQPQEPRAKKIRN